VFVLVERPPSEAIQFERALRLAMTSRTALSKGWRSLRHPGLDFAGSFVAFMLTKRSGFWLQTVA